LLRRGPPPHPVSQWDGTKFRTFSPTPAPLPCPFYFRPVPPNPKSLFFRRPKGSETGGPGIWKGTIFPLPREFLFPPHGPPLFLKTLAPHVPAKAHAPKNDPQKPPPKAPKTPPVKD